MAIVGIARALLPAGLDPISERAEVREGGLDSTAEQVREVVAGAVALVADPTVAVNSELLDAAGPGLRLVANFAVGYDNVDLDECRRRGVIVTNTPDVLTAATAELALALTLAAARLLGDAERDLRSGVWRGWDPAAYRGLELSGATVGVVGLGRIGSRYAELFTGFGAEILYTARSPKPELEDRLGAAMVQLDELLWRSDVVSLHVPATPETEHLIDAEALKSMGEGSVLVNTARGSLVDLTALAAALREQGLHEAAARFAYRALVLRRRVLWRQMLQLRRRGRRGMWVLTQKNKDVYKGIAKFFTFLSSPEIQSDWHQKTGYVPITLAAYDLTKKQRFYEKNPGTDIAIKELTNKPPTANSKGVRFGNFVQIRNIIDEEFETVWSGQKTAKQALDDAVRRGNEQVEKFEKANK